MDKCIELQRDHVEKQISFLLQISVFLIKAGNFSNDPRTNISLLQYVEK